MDITTLLLILVIGYVLYQSPLGCIVTPGQCIKNDVNSVGSFFGDLVNGIKNNL